MFAVAGAIAAAGPVIIHLLNRRRFRVLPWAAMDFLREAVKRNRRILQLRDILLLILRTACLLLFGLALARPYFARSGSGQVSSGQPLHAILLIDNSLSMAYRQGNQTLLDEVKIQGHDVINKLPEGSRISVVPLCGSSSGFSRDAYRTPKDANEALDKIDIADRSVTASRAVDLAKEAAQSTELPPGAKRIFLIGDQQLENWRGPQLATLLKGLPEMQIVDAAARNTENAWISEFRLLDGLADVSSPARFAAKVTYQGRAPRQHVQVTLSIDGADVQSRTIDLNPEQTAEVAFDYQFTDPPEAGQVRWSAAKVSIPPDRLDIDDARYLVVPVVAALPVLFIDQYGDGEDPKRNRLGETRPLRNLLAPQNVRGQSQLHLVRVIRRRMEQLDVKELREARLVVIAGVSQPESAESVRLLRDYVRQGGQLVIGAGSGFDPAAWTAQAWLDGAGILPLPLEPHPVGHTPDEATTDFKAFSLKVSQADVGNNAYLQLPDTDPQEVADSLREPTFFKAVAPIESQETIDKLLAGETKRIEQERGQLTDIDKQIEILAEKDLRGQLSGADRQALEAAERRRDAIVPNWLLFDAGRDRSAADRSAADRPIADQVAETRPKVVLRFDNNLPFLVERAIGSGRVLFFSSGFLTGWNDLSTKNAMWLIDRVLRAEWNSRCRSGTSPRSRRRCSCRSTPRGAATRFFWCARRQAATAGSRTHRSRSIRRCRERLRRSRNLPSGQTRVRCRSRVARWSDKRPASGTTATSSPSASPPIKSSDAVAGSSVENHWRDELIAANGPVAESQLAAIDEPGLAARMKSDAGESPHFRWVPRRADQSERRRGVGARHLVVADPRGVRVPAGGTNATGLARLGRESRYRRQNLAGAVCAGVERTSIMLTQFLGRLMGVENLQSIDSIRLSLAAPWAQSGPAWVLFGCVALAALSLVFYTRYQPNKRRKTLLVLAIGRAALLGLLFLILADPVLKMQLTSRPRPLLWVLFDGTESMDIQDEMPEAERARIAEAVGLPTGSAEPKAAEPNAAKSGRRE